MQDAWTVPRTQDRKKIPDNMAPKSQPEARSDAAQKRSEKDRHLKFRFRLRHSTSFQKTFEPFGKWLKADKRKEICSMSVLDE